MRVRPLTLLAMELAHLIDTGKYDGVTREEAYNAMKSKDVLGWLKRKIGDDSDLSPFLTAWAYGDFRSQYKEQMHRQYQAYGDQARRKWGIENRGLCLVLAWTVQMIITGSDLDFKDCGST